MSTKTNYYEVTIKGVTFDVYDILDAYGIHCPAAQHAIKKMLRQGRGDKEILKDIGEAKWSLERAAVLQERRLQEAAGQPMDVPGVCAEAKLPIGINGGAYSRDGGKTWYVVSSVNEAYNMCLLQLPSVFWAGGCIWRVAGRVFLNQLELHQP